MKSNLYLQNQTEVMISSAFKFCFVLWCELLKELFSPALWMAAAPASLSVWSLESKAAGMGCMCWAGRGYCSGPGWIWWVGRGYCSGAGWIWWVGRNISVELGACAGLGGIFQWSWVHVLGWDILRRCPWSRPGGSASWCCSRLTNITNHHKHPKPSQTSPTITGVCAPVGTDTQPQHYPGCISLPSCGCLECFGISGEWNNTRRLFPHPLPFFSCFFFFLFFWCVCLFSVVHKVVEPVSSLSNAGVCSAASSLLTKIHQHHTLIIIW